MNPSYNLREKHLPELTYLWRAGKELNHTTIDTYSGAQVTFPKSDLSLVKNPTSFLVKEKSHFNTALFLCLCQTHLHHPKEEKCPCRTHHHHPKEEHMPNPSLKTQVKGFAFPNHT